MQLDDFDFDLPEHLIATRPAVPRTAAKLLVAHQGRIEDARVHDLGIWLRPGDRLVLNDTRVIPARLNGTRYRENSDGKFSAKIEVTLLSPQADGTCQTRCGCARCRGLPNRLCPQCRCGGSPHRVAAFR